MATPEECSLYNQCGFVKWRAEQPYPCIVPLPKDGDCGIPIKLCLRVDPVIPIDVTLYTAATRPEMDVALPQLPDGHRITGGGHQ